MLSSQTQVAVLLGMNRCGSFPFLSAHHSLFSIWTDLNIWKDPRGVIVEVRRVDLANWTLRTSPKFTAEVRYQFHQDFSPDQRSGSPNHPSPIIHHQSVLPKGRPFTTNSGAKAAVLPKGRSFIGDSGTKVAVLLGMNRCGSFPLLSAHRSSFMIWRDLKIWKDPRGVIMEVRRVDLATWTLRT